MSQVAIPDGDYARKQLRSSVPVLNWSHRTRFRLARKLAEPFAGRRLLDYGCGDGTFLALVEGLFPDAVGADIDPGQLADCARRFATAPGTSFVPIPELADPRLDGSFGLVVCMEVLEHCLDKVQLHVLADLRRLVAPEGRVVISVPIETGLSLLGKQAGRWLAGWRGLRDYQQRESYSWRELCTMLFAREGSRIDRPVYSVAKSGDGSGYHGHKGFNWRALRRRLHEYFVIERKLFSPMGWMGSWLNSQVWFVCRPRPGTLPAQQPVFAATTQAQCDGGSGGSR